MGRWASARLAALGGNELLDVFSEPILCSPGHGSVRWCWNKKDQGLGANVYFLHNVAPSGKAGFPSSNERVKATRSSLSAEPVSTSGMWSSPAYSRYAL